MSISPVIKNEINDYFFITIGLLLYAFGWTVFLLPYQIVTGGVTGIAAIVFYATRIPIVYTYFIINVCLLIIALRILGFKFMTKTTYAIITLSVILWAAQKIMTGDDGKMVQVLGPGQDFMSLVIGCCFTGTSLAVVFLHNGSTGGTDIIAAVVNKYHNISLGRVLIFVDLLIIGSSLPIFNDWRKMVFGLCTMVIENFVLDYVMNARRESVQFMIFSGKYQEIANAIGTETEHGVTILDGHGWYTGQRRKVLCILAKKRESTEIFRLIKMIDPNAFVSQSSVIGVYGEGFDEMRVKVKSKKKKMKIVFATNNKNKLREIRNILSEDFEIVSLADIGCNEDIPETGSTLEENAMQKAKYIYDKYNIDCFADDTGLEVDALNGMPGVHSARYAEGVGHDSEANMAKLLHNLDGKMNRTAKFRTVITLIRKGKKPMQFEGRIDGQITKEKHGTGGFGYDPIFMPSGYDKSFAELGDEIKNGISHRARAVNKLADYLKNAK